MTKGTMNPSLVSPEQILGLYYKVKVFRNMIGQQEGANYNVGNTNMVTTA
jgi:hypothetical protein